ncbi:MAG: hypothetical protein VW441_08180 [Flavobacteriaceae bacterium]
MKKLVYYFGFTYLKKRYALPLRLLIISYTLLLVIGLVYDLSNDRIGYYSTTTDYLQILFTDPNFYYLYIAPYLIIFMISYLWAFFISLEQKSNQQQKKKIKK